MTTRDTMYSEDISQGPGGEHDQSISVLQEGITSLPPELDTSGNVEYKTKLDNISETRAKHLATQLQWRLAEGDGHAVYVVGVHDNGDIVGITEKEFRDTIETINSMAEQLDNTCVASVDRRVLGDNSNRIVAEVHLTQRNALPRTELRVAVLGDHSVGKSTVLGCLTYGESDDGRGKARVSLLRHRHELETGRTSSISLGTVGFTAEGQMQNYANNRSAEHIYRRSRHVVTFIDTCGHEKHLKTTARAITGHSPQVFCVVIAADTTGISATTREYLRMAAALEMPLMVVVSKMDVAEKSTFSMLMYDVLHMLDAEVPERDKCIVANSAEHALLAEDMMRLAVVPVFTTSAVRSVGFGELTTLLEKARACRTCDSSTEPSYVEDADDDLFEFDVEHLYSIDSVGSVATGWVRKGTIAVSEFSNRPLIIGPDASGSFADVKVSSIHTLRIPSETACAGRSAALAIQPHKALLLQKGMVILDANLLGKGGRVVSNELTAMVTVFDASVSKMQNVAVHIRAACYLARIVQIEDDVTHHAYNGQTDNLKHAMVRLALDADIQVYSYPDMPIVVRGGRCILFAGRIAATQS
ncbi:GTP binding protein [Coemansia sp. RSA 988]|nr:GTP binding protein [Coemansia sp. RSA 988]